MAWFKRTIPLKGTSSPEGVSQSDEGKWFRCWNCGWRCNIERDTLGGENTRAGDGAQFYYQFYPQSDGSDRGKTTDFELAEEGITEMDDGSTGRGNIALARLAMLRGHAVGMAQKACGSAKEIRLTYESLIYGGCPLCGSKNYA